MKLVVPVLVLGSFAAAGGGSDWVLHADAHGNSYSDKEVGEVVVSGVCRISLRGVDCWTPGGSHNPELTKTIGERVTAMHLQFSESSRLAVITRVQTYGARTNEVMRFGKAFDEAKRGGGSIWVPIEHSTFRRVLKVTNKSPTGQVVAESYTPPFNDIWFVPPSAVKATIDLFVPMGVPLATQRMSVGDGDPVKIGPVTIKPNGFKTGELKLLPMEKGAPKAWIQQDYSQTSSVSGLGFQVWPTFLDKRGEMLSEMRDVGNGRMMPVGQETVMAWQSWQTRTSHPQDAAAIELHPSYTRWITFHNVALKPKP